MRPPTGSGATPATTALLAAGIEFVTYIYEPDPRAGSWGIDAAETLGFDPAVVFKTLIVSGAVLADLTRARI